MATDATYPGPTSPMLGARLRTATEAVHRDLYASLTAAGYGDLRPAHFNLLKFPGPHGARPTELAARVGMSKQALNPLLNELESMGYLVRTGDADDGRGRVVHLSARGMSLVAELRKSLEEVETRLRDQVGSLAFDTFMHVLGQVEDITSTTSPSALTGR